jgi:ferric-dicitrate binding protein FerR (iron transport regulator)
MQYGNFSTDDFIKDEYFQKWVFVSDEDTLLFWENFLIQYPDKKPDVFEAKQFLQVLNLKEKDIIESRIVALKKNIDLVISTGAFKVGEGRQPQPLHKRSNLKVYAVAATLAIFILVAFVLLHQKHIGVNYFTSRLEKQNTMKGQRNLLVLQDGTRVWLNADSHLEYPESFSGRDQREVYLEGEAYFDVTTDKNKTFIVKTSDISIKVLGTSFNVKSYAEGQVETTLVHGRVSIELKDHEKITLSPNQQAIFDRTSKKIVVENHIVAENYTGWKNGMLLFDDQPFYEIKAALERWYNITIHIEDQVSLQCRFSARFENKTLAEVLELFKTSEGIDYTVEGKEIFISGKLCKEN